MHIHGKYNFVGKLREKISNGLNHFIENIYLPFLTKLIGWRYVALSVAIAVLIIIAGLVKGGIVKIIFFPRDDSNFILAKIEMNPGTTIADTERVSQRVLLGWQKVAKKYANRVSDGKELATGVFTLIGGTTKHGGGVTKTSELEMNINLVDSEYRDIFSQVLIDDWQKAVGPIAGAHKTTFSKQQPGPGGSAIMVRLKGENYDDLLAAANILEGKIASYPGIFDEKIDYEPGKREFIITMKESAYHHGLSLENISDHIRSGFYGKEVLRVQSGKDDIKVKVRYPEKAGRNSIESLKNLYITATGGKRMPLSSLVDIKLKEGQKITSRFDRKRVIDVLADVNENGNLVEIMKDLKTNVFSEIEARYPVICEIGGQEKERVEAMGGLYVGFPLALLGIYFIIASMFRSYIQPVVIMTAIPFGLLGGVLGHIIMGKPLSLLSMFGLVALAGIVVNDAIVLIEAVNGLLSEGVPLRIAVCQGGKRRFRAILLTTLTTGAGLLPLILERSFQAQFLIPMAISIAFGVFFATFLTLLLMPCLLVILSDFRRLWHRLWSQEWREREELEPRSSSFMHQEL
jgi:multidrug efflux pump subunit AcrB